MSASLEFFLVQANLPAALRRLYPKLNFVTLYYFLNKTYPVHIHMLISSLEATSINSWPENCSLFNLKGFLRRNAAVSTTECCSFYDGMLQFLSCPKPVGCKQKCKNSHWFIKNQKIWSNFFIIKVCTEMHFGDDMTNLKFQVNKSSITKIWTF